MGDPISIKLFAGLKEHFTIPDSLDLTVEHTVKDIIDAMAIPEEKAAIVFISNRHAKLEDTVKPGEVLALFPPIGGG